MFERLGNMARRLRRYQWSIPDSNVWGATFRAKWAQTAAKGAKNPCACMSVFPSTGGQVKKNQPSKSHFNGGGEWSSGNQAWGQRLVRVQLHGGVDVCLVVGLGDVWDAKNGKDRPQSGMMEQAVLRVTSYITYNNIIIVAIGVPLCAITIKLHGNITSYVCMYMECTSSD